MFFFYKGKSFCDSLLAFRHKRPILKRVFTKRKDFAPQREQILSFRVDPFPKGRQNSLKELPPLKVFPHYENTPIPIYWKFYHKKLAIFRIKKSDIFHISAQNINCGYSLEPPRRGGSNEYPQSMFLSRNNKNNVYPCKPQFYYIKVGFKGSKLYRHFFVMIPLKLK